MILWEKPELARQTIYLDRNDTTGFDSEQIEYFYIHFYKIFNQS